MHIVAHRGLFNTKHGAPLPNSKEAIRAAFAAGFGVETDVRDFAGHLVISHDPPAAPDYLFDEFLKDWRDAGYPEFALNIKSSGLASRLVDALAPVTADTYYAFDLAFPDLLTFTKRGLRTYTRLSDYEGELLLLERCAGVWVDGFDRDLTSPSDLDALTQLVATGKKICLVSPELHGRPHVDAWRAWATLSELPGVSICTDFPHDARSFFASPAAK